MVYNITDIANNASLVSLTQNVNTQLMGGWLGSLFLIGCFFVVFTSILFSINDLKRSLSASLFITFGLSLCLRILDMVPDLAVYVCLVGLGMSLFFTWRN